MSVEGTGTSVEVLDGSFDQIIEDSETIWNGRIVSLSAFEFQKIPIVLCAQEPENNTEITQEDVQEHFDNAKDHLDKFAIESAAAGVSMTHGPLGIAFGIYELKEASDNFLEACKEYNEGKKLEAELEKQRLEKQAEERRLEAEAHNRGKDDYERSHDHDSWDREY